MGVHADNVVKYFAGPLGIRPWDIGDRLAGGKPAQPRFRGIMRQDIRDFVLECADKLCQDYFWTRPAAKQNRYHPEVSCGEGGLVRHTWYACFWGAEGMRKMDDYSPGTTPYGNEPTVHNDVVLASLILHDMMKEGDPLKAHLSERKGEAGRRLIGGCHGVDMAEAILTRVLNGSVPSREHMFILYAIAGHMGNWTVPEKHRPQNVQDPEARLVAQIVHDADYNASRKCDSVARFLLAGGIAGTGESMSGEPTSQAAA